MRRLWKLAPHAASGAMLVALALSGIGWVLQFVYQPLAGLDASVQDFVLARRSPESYLGSAANTPRDPRTFITIVAIDDRTLAELGAYNGGYPRAYHAKVIENLLAAPPRVIAFDLGFFEPTPDDELLAAAFDHARSLPVPTNVILSEAGLTHTGKPLSTQASQMTYDAELEPIPLLGQRSSLALANLVPDERGTVRSMPTVASLSGVEQPSLSLAAVASYLRRPSFLDGRSSSTLQLAGRTVPVDDRGLMRINFFGAPSHAYAADSTFRVVSFVDVLRGRIDPPPWRDGMVFIGALGATGLADDYWTPTSAPGRKMAGVEIHANAAATLFSMNFLQTAPAAAEAMLFIGVALGIAVIVTQLNVLSALAAGSAVLAILAAVEIAVLALGGLLLPIGLPLVVGFVQMVGLLVPRLITEQHLARTARAALAAERARDRLTGLVNRSQLLDELQQLLPGSLALLVVDVDRLKDVNDSLGHRIGDALLQQLAQRLQHELVGITARLARLDGDEFAVALIGDSSQQATVIAERLQRAAELPIVIDQHRLAVTMAVGIAVHPEHGTDPETLLRHADSAVFAAKQARTGHAIFTLDQERRTNQRVEMVAALREVIAAGGLSLEYQPKVECKTGRVLGVEALVRWNHPSEGNIPPDQFVRLAEQTGLIAPLTRQVLEKAVAQARAWNDAQLPVKIAVNLSAYDLQDSRLPRFISELLDRYAVPAQRLSLEITETALLVDPSRALEVLKELAANGVDASLDDFGTGFSSLTYLRELPLCELKIDSSFIRGVAVAERDRAIVCSTIELGHRLGLSVVAEGVEDGQSLKLLTELGCDQAQGFYLSRPMPAERLAHWMSSIHFLESRGDIRAA